MKENQIVDIDGYVHVINGKVVCFEPNVFDLKDIQDVKNLVDLSASLFVSEIRPAIYGEDTMAVIKRHPDGVRRILSMSCITGLPESLQQKVRCAVREFSKS